MQLQGAWEVASVRGDGLDDQRALDDHFRSVTLVFKDDRLVTWGMPDDTLAQVKVDADQKPKGLEITQTKALLGKAKVLHWVYELDGEGSAGPLDLVANDGQGLWHQQVWPRLGLGGKRAGKTIVFTVTDAGDPVAGAQVKVAGKTLTTAANGRAVLAKAPAGKVKASASKAGYTGATTSVR